MGVPINKVAPQVAESERELRVISLTPFLSKTFESIVLDWILEFVGLDWNQYGGVRGSLCNHYLIDLITFILFNQDLKVPKAVLATTVSAATH